MGNNTTKIEVLFGKIAISCGFITESQLERAVQLQGQEASPKHLGRLLVDTGAMSEEELMTVLAIQRENRSRAEMSPAVRKLGMTLGALAIEKGYCTEEEVHACIREQARLERFNLFFRLGEVMVSRGVMSIDQVHELLKSQNITILGCPGCFSKFNVLNFKDGMQIECPKCGTMLEEPSTITSIKVDDNINDAPDRDTRKLKKDRPRRTSSKLLKFLKDGKDDPPEDE